MNKQQFLAISLPFGLKCLSSETGYVYDIISCHFVDYVLVRVKQNNGRDFPLPINRIKPILYNLSDYEKFDDMLGLIYCNEIFRVIKGWQKIEDLSFWLVNKMIELHIDVFSLIEKGEAIDVNTLSVNPYK